MTDYCEGDLIEVTRQIKAAFTKYKRMFTRNFRTTAARHNRIWEKAAKTCLEAGIDPEDFVAAQFNRASNPYPSMLSGQGALVRYRSYMAETTDVGRAAMYITIQMDLVLSRARLGTDMRRFLTESPKLCPLIKYVAASVLGLDDVAAAFLEPARTYGSVNPQVVRVVKERFPGVEACNRI